MDARRTARTAVVVGTVVALATACGGGGPAPAPGGTATVTSTPHEASPTPKPKTKEPQTPTGTATGGHGDVAPSSTVVTALVVAGHGFEVLDDGDVTGSPFSETTKVGKNGCEGWRSGFGASTHGLVRGARTVLRDAGTGRRIGEGRLGAGKVVNVDPRSATSLTPQWQCEFTLRATVTGRAPDRLQLRVDGARTMNAVRLPGTAVRYVASVSSDADPMKVDECRHAGADAPHRWTAPAVGEPWDVGMGFVCRDGMPVSLVRRVCRPARIASDRIVRVLDANNDKVLEDTRGLHIPHGYDFGVAFGSVVEVSTGVPCR